MTPGSQNRFWILGIVVLGACGLGAIASPQQFFRSYLLGYVFWVNVALGCLPLLMLQYLTGGAWGLVIRRLLEAGASTLPAMAVLFLPIAFGLDRVYLWAQPDVVAGDALLQHKALYLNVPFFLARTVLYFAIWITLATLLLRWSQEQDRTADPAVARRLEVFSGPAIGVYALTVTFAAVDWVMSLDPHWFSTIFGMWFVAGQGLAAFAFAIVALVRLSDEKAIAEVIRPSIYHDLGKLLLAFVMVWAYLSFSQFLIIYSGNLLEEITYYLDRSQGGWQWIAGIVVVFHFAVPFVALLSRDLKRNAGALAGLAGFVLFLRYVDLLWTIVPTFSHGAMHLHWMDLAAPIGIGGVWLAVFIGRLQSKPLLPLHDPYAAEAFAAGAEH